MTTRSEAPAEPVELPADGVAQIAAEVASNMRRPPWRSRRRLIIAAIIVSIVGGTIYGIALKSFLTIRDEREVEGFGIDVADGTLGINADVSKVDPVGGRVTLQITSSPAADLLAEGVLRNDIELVINAADGTSTRRFDAGSRIDPFETTLLLSDGDIADYPWDSYTTELAVRASLQQGGELEELPTEVRITGRPFGYRVGATEEPPVYGLERARIDIERWGPIRTLASAGFVLILLLAIGAAIAALRLLLQRRAVEFPYLFFTSTLLFSFPALRNAFPDAPPIGVLGDFLCFFWGIGLVSLTLLALLARLAFPPKIPEGPEVPN